MDAMTRIALVHLHVTIPAGEERTADQIADALVAALKFDSYRHAPLRGLDIICPLAEEIYE